MSDKVRVTIYVSEVYRDLAKILGLNISHVCEQALKKAVGGERPEVLEHEIRETERKLQKLQEAYAMVKNKVRNHDVMVAEIVNHARKLQERYDDFGQVLIRTRNWTRARYPQVAVEVLLREIFRDGIS